MINRFIGWALGYAKDWFRIDKRNGAVFTGGRLLGTTDGFSIWIHKFVDADDEGCFHSHPAWAFRLILKGGYVEQRPDGRYFLYSPGSCGFITPDFEHRIHKLLGPASYSLWIRGPIIAKIRFGCR